MIKKLLGLRGVWRYIPCNWIGLNWGAAVSDDIFLTENPGRGPDDQGGARVVQLADFDNVQPARIVAELRDYWDSLRQGRAIPARGDVEPRGIRRALDYAFILERIAPGAARFRLAGRHLVDLMGMEVRGMPVCSFLNPPSRGRLSDVLETVFKAPQIAELHLTAQAEMRRPALHARMLLLPLKSDLGDVTRALGCLIAEGDPGYAPRRFDLDRDIITPVLEGAKVMAPSPSARGFAEQPAPWRGDKGTAATPTGGATGSTAATPPAPQTPEERRACFRLISRED